MNESVPQSDEGNKEASAKEQSYFFVCVPNSAFGTSVFEAEDKQDAANKYAASVGVSPINDEQGNDSVRVAVVELDTISIDHDKVNELLNPDDKKE